MFGCSFDVVVVAHLYLKRRKFFWMERNNVFRVREWVAGFRPAKKGTETLALWVDETRISPLFKFECLIPMFDLGLCWNLFEMSNQNFDKSRWENLRVRVLWIVIVIYGRFTSLKQLKTCLTLRNFRFPFLAVPCFSKKNQRNNRLLFWRPLLIHSRIFSKKEN